MTTPGEPFPIEELTPEEKEAFLARVRAQGRSLTSEEQYALFGPPREKVQTFRESEVVEEMEAAPLDVHEQQRLAADFFPELGGAGGSSSLAPRLVQGVIFDFDHTLATPSRPLGELQLQGAQDALAFMRGTGMELPDDFAGHIVEARRFAEEKSADEHEEHLADDALSFLLQFYGFPASRMDPHVLRQAVDIFYAHEMVAWRLRPDVIATLATLRQSGYRIALLANHNADRVFQRTVDYLGIRDYLDVCIASAAVEYRKPDPAFFNLVLDRWGALPYEVVVVGDSLKDDVAGAIETGCLSVLLQSEGGNAQTAHDNEMLAAEVRPDASIAALSELPALIHAWSLA